MAKNTGYDEDEIDALFNKADLNNDKVIGFDEFVEMHTRLVLQKSDIRWDTTSILNSKIALQGHVMRYHCPCCWAVCRTCTLSMYKPQQEEILAAAPRMLNCLHRAHGNVSHAGWLSHRTRTGARQSKRGGVAARCCRLLVGNGFKSEQCMCKCLSARLPGCCLKVLSAATGCSQFAAVSFQPSGGLGATAALPGEYAASRLPPPPSAPRLSAAAASRSACGAYSARSRATSGRSLLSAPTSTSACEHARAHALRNW
eukprot:366196-Chlamydomonas_euryale.AAC.10